VLHAAAMIESTSLMTALIEAGAEINLANRDGETPLYWAAMTGTFLAVKALADAGADLNRAGRKNGQYAASRRGFHDDIVLIHYLISKNVRTDIRNNADLTPLDLAQSAAAARRSSSSASMVRDRRSFSPRASCAPSPTA